MSKTDLRVIKTRQNIKKAFLDIMKEKNYNSITVKEISDKALINRKTFYFYYETKDDLYNEIASEVTAIMSPEEILNGIQKSSREGQRKIIRHFLTELKKNKHVCSVFLNDVTNPGFNNIIKAKLSNALLSKSTIKKKIASTYITTDFFIDAYYDIFKNVLRWWFTIDSDDPDIAIDCLLMLLSKDLLQLLNINI